MQLGVFAKTFDGRDPAAVLTQVRDAGFRTAQYNMACSGFASMPETIPQAAAAAVAAAANDTQVSIAAVSGTYNMIHPDRAVRTRGHARLATLAAACRTLGTSLVTLCTGTRDPDDMWRAHSGNADPAAWQDLLEAMEVAIGIADAHDITLGVEPERSNVVSSAERARALIAELGSPRVRIVIDPANLFDSATPEEQRTIVSRAIEASGDHLVMAHAKDRAADGRFVAAGHGVIDWTHYLHCLASAGFEGPVVAHGLRADEAPAVADFLARMMRDLAIPVMP